MPPEPGEEIAANARQQVVLRERPVRDEFIDDLTFTSQRTSLAPLVIESGLGIGRG
ncbi:hypothetical protein [Glaciihabitans sp. UYNi722]|uniref:hypothetical protein n=1 Tax=Glaciihabitans sp. UYNi722 TaxID=3156344 RepID=UPI0033979BE8